MKLNSKVLYVIGVLLFVGTSLIPRFSNAESCPLAVNKPYKIKNSPSVFYVSPDCTKRPIRDPETYFSYFSSWAEVRVVTESQLSSIRNDVLGFLPWGPKKVFQEGSIIKSPTEDKVFIVLNQKLHAFETEQDFLASGYKWEWVEDVTPEVIRNYSRGNDFSTISIPDGLVFKFEHSPSVYYVREVDGGIDLKYIRSMTELKGLWYRSDRIATFSDNRYLLEGAARDAKRLSDIKQIQIALELYYTDHNMYPVMSVQLGSNDARCLNGDGFKREPYGEDCRNPYMGWIPKGPLTNEYYYYTSSLPGSTYTISVVLENGSEGLAAGTIIASPSGITQ